MQVLPSWNIPRPQFLGDIDKAESRLAEHLRYGREASARLRTHSGTRTVEKTCFSGAL